jgi:hypothetical protein
MHRGIAMKFTIEIPDQGDFIIYDKGGTKLDKVDETTAQNLKNIKRAGTLNMTFLKTNSGWVVIGGRTYWIP